MTVSAPNLSAVVFTLLMLFALPAINPAGFFGAANPGTAHAQAGGLNSRDLSNVRSADVSDAQLRAYINRAREEGLSETDAFNMARQRGLPASEAQALRARIRELERNEATDAGADSVNRTRTSGRADSQSLQQYPDQYPGGRELTGDGAREREMEMERERELQMDPDVRRTFGSDVFSRRGVTFEPSHQIPTPVNYVLGVGDEIIIDIWGAATNVHRLEVSTEGTVSIDNLGPIYVHGLTIKEAEERILDKLQTIYFGLRPGSSNASTFARVSLGRLRSIQVTVIGDVTSPGNYTVSSLATVYNALYNAGGPNSRGSFRRIQVFRGNEVISELDLYDFLIHGNQSDNIRLQDQDVIKIDPYEQRVDIRGEVRRNGYFQLIEGETLADLIRYAGNFTHGAYTRQIRVHRNTPTERSIVTVNRDQFDQFTLQNGDVVHVDEILERFENKVEITGAVWRSGEFELREGMTLHDLIMEADGLRPDAYRSRGIINRIKDDYSFELVAFDVDQVMENPAQYDIPLKREDQVIIQTIFDMREELTVRINGAVQEAGTFDWRENMTLEDLILKASGFRESASEARIEVSRRILGDPAPNERGTQTAETFLFDVSRNLQLSDADRKFTLEPFDQVFVRRKPDYQVQLNVTVEGEVLYPGTYTLIDRNERISEVIKRSGGLTSEAYLKGATLIRQKDQEERAEVSLDFMLEEEEIVEPVDESRIGIDLVRIMANPGSRDDLFLREGDVLSIPQIMQTVRVSGAVMQDVEVRYLEGQNIGYYINRAGGYAEDARARRAYVIYANGDVRRRRSYMWGLIRSSPDIDPGAEIIVPAKPEQERLSTGEIISISSAVVSMAATITIMIDRLAR